MQPTGNSSYPQPIAHDSFKRGSLNSGYLVDGLKEGEERVANEGKSKGNNSVSLPIKQTRYGFSSNSKGSSENSTSTPFGRTQTLGESFNQVGL